MTKKQMVTTPHRLSPNPWEVAYLRFETPQQERRKFVRRLDLLGASRWPRDARIVELFCGRGNGLRALAEMNFNNIEGVDLSSALLAQYAGAGRVQVADCRSLPFEDESKEVLIVQGGLHHLPELPGDLEATLSEARRVLTFGGLFCVVEPWLTPFLWLVHTLCENAAARRFSDRVDALATMIDQERQTYEQWLREPKLVLSILEKFFSKERRFVRWGKLYFIGRKARD